MIISTASRPISPGVIQNYVFPEKKKVKPGTKLKIVSSTLPSTVGPAMSWKSFASTEYKLMNSITAVRTAPDLQTKLCPLEVVQRLNAKTLSSGDIKWCKWATSTRGGNVIVGKSWGNLNAIQDRKRFDALNCNSVISRGTNPSCDDAWGDNSVRKW